MRGILFGTMIESWWKYPSANKLRHHGELRLPVEGFRSEALRGQLKRQRLRVRRVLLKADSEVRPFGAN